MADGGFSRTLVDHVFAAYHVTPTGRNQHLLPVGLPAPLQREHLVTVTGRGTVGTQYVVSPKADGTRYLAVMYGQVAALLNRTGAGEACTQSWQPTRTALCGTVLDVEVIEHGAERWIWVFDAIEVNGHAVHQQPYHYRLCAAFRFLCDWAQCRRWPEVTHLAPAWTPARRAHLVLPPDHHRVWTVGGRDRWTLKPVWYHCGLDAVHAWTAGWVQPPFPQDGLVFTPATRPVSTYRDLALFKWKPLDALTVDFLIRRPSPDWMELHTCNDTYQLQLFATVPWRAVPQVACTFQPNRVYECRWDRATQAWELVRCRWDKNEPNVEFTVRQTLKERESTHVSWDELHRALCPPKDKSH